MLLYLQNHCDEFTENYKLLIIFGDEKVKQLELIAGLLASFLSSLPFISKDHF